MMGTVTVSMTQAKNELADVVNRVAYGRERIILLSRSKPRAAVVSFEDLQVLEELQEEKKAHQARMEGWLTEARALRQEILKRREGISLPDSVEMLQELREERDGQILGDSLQSSSGL
jgi:prevent-host-death family protein